MKNGLILIDKQPGITSQGVVTCVKRLFGAEKAGHTGTLDPMATGVLPVLIGRAVKASAYLLSSEKHYIATLLLGVSTDTEDTTGRILTTSEDIPSKQRVFDTVDGFVGEILQIPPMYSALKVGGKKLVDLAREGIEVARDARPVTIHRILPTQIDERRYALDVICSKGTYIRTLCADIGRALGCGGAMESLRRAEAGGFSLDACHTLEELEAMSESERDRCILPTERLFADRRAVTLSAFFSRLARCGVEIYTEKIRVNCTVGEQVTLWDDVGFFALGEVRLFDGKPAIKPIIQFDIRK